MKRLTALILLQSLLICSFVSAQEQKELVLESSQTQTNLLEVYVSQGCSSCPPAQDWVNTLIDDSQLWRDIIPIVFHVDYWDYIGWKDPFSSSAYTQRQRLYRTKGHVKSVYTPGFILNGREWRGWFMRRPLPANMTKARLLKTQISPTEIVATYSEDQNEGLALNIVILGFDIRTDVEGGENKGRRLEEEFAVLSFETHFSNTGQWQIPFPKDIKHSAPRYAIALWVTGKEDLTPLQATGGWLPQGFDQF